MCPELRIEETNGPKPVADLIKELGGLVESGDLRKFVTLAQTIRERQERVSEVENLNEMLRDMFIETAQTYLSSKRVALEAEIAERETDFSFLFRLTTHARTYFLLVVEPAKRDVIEAAAELEFGVNEKIEEILDRFHRAVWEKLVAFQLDFARSIAKEGLYLFSDELVTDAIEVAKVLKAPLNEEDEQCLRDLLSEPERKRRRSGIGRIRMMLEMIAKAACCGDVVTCIDSTAEVYLKAVEPATSSSKVLSPLSVEELGQFIIIRQIARRRAKELKPKVAAMWAEKGEPDRCEKAVEEAIQAANELNEPFSQEELGRLEELKKVARMNRRTLDKLRMRENESPVFRRLMEIIQSRKREG